MGFQDFHRDHRWIFYLSCLALLGVAVILVFTRFGPGASGDSVYYIMGGQNIADGNGFSRTSGGGEIKPITGFPPFFSLVMSSFAFIGINMFAGGRGLNTLLFAANIFLTGFIIYRYCRSMWPALIGGALVLSSNTIIESHGWIMSEPLYVFLMLLAIYTVVRYLEGHNRSFWVLSIIFISLASLTRFVGVALTAAGVFAILVLDKRKFTRRLVDSIFFGILSLIPLVLWMMRNSFIAGTSTNRAWIYHPIRPELAIQYLAEISSWFAPGQLPVPEVIRAAFSISFVLILLSILLHGDIKKGLLNREKQAESFDALPWILCAYILSYLGIIVINSLFLDAATTPAAPPRYLLPVYIACVILFTSVIYRLIGWNSRSLSLKYIAVAYGVMLLVINSILSFNILRYPLPMMGYTGLKQQWPDVVARLKEVDPSTAIISNNPEMVYVFTERPAYMRPISFDVYKLTNREDYSEQLEWVQSLLDDGGFYVQLREPSPDDIEAIEDLNIEVRYSFPAAWIYVAR